MDITPLGEPEPKRKFDEEKRRYTNEFVPGEYVCSVIVGDEKTPINLTVPESQKQNFKRFKTIRINVETWVSGLRLIDPPINPFKGPQGG